MKTHHVVIKIVNIKLENAYMFYIRAQGDEVKGHCSVCFLKMGPVFKPKWEIGKFLFLTSISPLNLISNSLNSPGNFFLQHRSYHLWVLSIHQMLCFHLLAHLFSQKTSSWGQCLVLTALMSNISHSTWWMVGTY